MGRVRPGGGVGAGRAAEGSAGRRPRSRQDDRPRRRVRRLLRRARSGRTRKQPTLADRAAVEAMRAAMLTSSASPRTERPSPGGPGPPATPPAGSPGTRSTMPGRWRTAPPMPDSSETGATTVRYANGNVKMEGAHLDGEMHGPWRWFRTDGTVMRTGAFERGRQIGPWRTFDRAGSWSRRRITVRRHRTARAQQPTSVATSAASIGRGASISPTAAAAPPMSSGAGGTGRAQVADRCGPVGLGQLSAVVAADQRVMRERRRRLAAEQPAQADLGGRLAEQVARHGRPGRRPGGGRRRRPRTRRSSCRPGRDRQVAAAAGHLVRARPDETVHPTFRAAAERDPHDRPVQSTRATPPGQPGLPRAVVVRPYLERRREQSQP